MNKLMRSFSLDIIAGQATVKYITQIGEEIVFWAISYISNES